MIPDFKNSQEYYERASCTSSVSKIKVPTLVIHAEDDPICHISDVPLDDLVSNKNIVTVITRRDGHVCFFEGFSGTRRWYPRVSSDFLNSALALQGQQNEVPETSTIANVALAW